MPALPARSNAEAHLYMELHPCPQCGELEFSPGSSIVLVDGDLATRYAGPCPRCGGDREFLFRVPDEAAFPDEDEPSFGAEQPSSLVDAGQWLWLADLIAGGVPARPDAMTGQERAQARFDLRTAAAAVAEAIKFIPSGADAVPREALWSERGHGVYRDEPSRFRRYRLEAAHRAYRELAERFA